MNLGDRVLVNKHGHPFNGSEVILIDNSSTLFQVRNETLNKELPVWAWDVQPLGEPQ